MTKPQSVIEHVPHPHIEKRKELERQRHEKKRGFNNALAVAITNVVGTMWCAYVFAIIALISLPEAIKAGTGALIAWIAQTFLQLVLLSIIMVGQRVQSEKSDQMLNQTFNDAEALLQINDEVHRLVKQNAATTEQIDRLLKENTSLTQEVSNHVCGGK